MLEVASTDNWITAYRKGFLMNSLSNPYETDTPNFRAWNLGLKHRILEDDITSSKTLYRILKDDEV